MVDGKDEYEGTPSLWELIVSKKKKKKTNYHYNYNDEDEKNYTRLMVKTNALHQNNDPNNPYPKSSKLPKCLEKILSPIWFGKKDYKGKGVVVVPSDPNALLERLDLLLSSNEAGHTGVGNEFISICDELKRQGVLDTKTYKKLNCIIKNDST